MQRRMTLSAHVAMFVLAECSPQTVDDFYLAYLEVRHCGLELGHSCDNEPCINPEHVSLMTHSQNCAQKYERKETA